MNIEHNRIIYITIIIAVYNTIYSNEEIIGLISLLSVIILVSSIVLDKLRRK